MFYNYKAENLVVFIVVPASKHRVWQYCFDPVVEQAK